jgi:hypothetical protein
MVTDDGENRYGVAPTLIVVVGPLVVHAAARVAVGFGFVVDIVGDGVLTRRVVVAVGEAVFVTFVRFVDFVTFGVGVGDADEVWDAEAVTGVDFGSCPSTFAEPLLHAVAASTSARAAATLPEVRMSA